MKTEDAATFGSLVDLAAAAVGGVALATNDDFFAGKENLLEPGRGVFLPDEYTDRGKWMDGWESRRKRGPGYDWCIIRLGLPGQVRALDIDTNHFLGNHPPFASVDALKGDPALTLEELEAAEWTEILPQSALRPGSQNLFPALPCGEVTHLRLNIFPDGGVARLRAYGDVAPGWHDRPDDLARTMIGEGDRDLAALRNGGRAIACSDSFFGPMDNLIRPGRAENMGGGWETRRRRGPGHDWIVVKLAGAGIIGCIEVDTNHFKGNFPDTCQVDGINAPGAQPTDILWGKGDWQLVLPRTRLAASARAFFRDDLAQRGPFTHVRLSVYPDGGVSRLRIFGAPA